MEFAETPKRRLSLGLLPVCCGAAVLFLGNVIAFPVYWYYYIWPEKDAPLAARDRKSLYYTDPAHWVNHATTNENKGDYVPPPAPPDWR